MLLALIAARGREEWCTFRDLVSRARSGQSRAIRHLVAQLMPVIRARVHHFLAGHRNHRLGPHDADDLVQEIWMVLLKDDSRLLDAYDFERGTSPQGYVGLIAQREIWNRLQREKALKRGGGLRETDPEHILRQAGERGNPELDVETRQLIAGMSEHLERSLPERGLAVLQELYTNGRPASDVAARLGVSRQVVYNWQHRIRKEARLYLDTHDV